jgi:hypothetical protein
VQSNLKGVFMPAAIKNSSTPTALFGAISGLIVVLGLNLGIDIGPELAAAIVMVAAGIISLLNPRWAQARGIFVKRPVWCRSYDPGGFGSSSRGRAKRPGGSISRGGRNRSRRCEHADL